MGELWTPTLTEAKLRYCVCCNKAADQRVTTFVGGGVVKRIPATKVKALLCADCAHGPETPTNVPSRRHTAGYCTACGMGPIWKCQTRQHVAERHPELMQKFVNDDYNEIYDVPQPEYLGTVEVEQRDAEFPKRIF